MLEIAGIGVSLIFTTIVSEIVPTAGRSPPGTTSAGQRLDTSSAQAFKVNEIRRHLGTSSSMFMTVLGMTAFAGLLILNFRDSLEVLLQDSGVKIRACLADLPRFALGFTLVPGAWCAGILVGIMWAQCVLMAAFYHIAVVLHMYSVPGAFVLAYGLIPVVTVLLEYLWILCFLGS